MFQGIQERSGVSKRCHGLSSEFHGVSRVFQRLSWTFQGILSSFKGVYAAGVLQRCSRGFQGHSSVLRRISLVFRNVPRFSRGSRDLPEV